MSFLALTLCLILLQIGYYGISGWYIRPLTDCRIKGETCRGFPKCCDTLQCYWEDGVKPWPTNGECVECVDRSLVCQRDAQCCGSNLICQKDYATDINGVCDILRQAGERCHEDNQCVSGRCNESWLSGTCE